MTITKFYNYLIDYILPSRCLACSEILNSKGEFCSSCWGKLDFIAKPYCSSCGRKLEIAILENFCCTRCYHNKPNYDLARSLLKFNEYSKKIIHQFKYQDKTVFAKTFAKLLCNRYAKEIENIDLIVPVPMNRFKRLLRMYNPAHILAQEIAKITGKNIKADTLIKAKWTKSQTFLSKKQRVNNIKNSIKFNKKYEIAKQKILLIDDVITTGTTIYECSKILRKAGANSIYVMTIAMT
ncbi:ComF family protein [Rickettsia endosymbiont of Halotydeus destructor]|uniref:ComF family protein n=1 Tax=Rickettsia endosymbiont of Halotydeus destructor TaxID=2996754 RepID=UPI003BAF737F